jgi:peptidase S41-like protein
MQVRPGHVFLSVVHDRELAKANCLALPLTSSQDRGVIIWRIRKRIVIGIDSGGGLNFVVRDLVARIALAVLVFGEMCLQLPAQPQLPPPPPPPQTTAVDIKLDSTARHRVILKVNENLKQYYIDPPMAKKIGDALVAHEKNGDDDATTDGNSFASLLTKQIRDVSHDMHLEVMYTSLVLPDQPPGTSPEIPESFRQEMQRTNCMFEKVEVLPHNIGYLKLNFFPELSICRAIATAAMTRLNKRGCDHLRFARQPRRLSGHRHDVGRLPV